MVSRPFAKYEGLGNDFVVLEAAHWPADELTPALARAVCDRHRGVGADGVLWLDRSENDAHDARLVILNADGSRPEMCGNGVRCVAGYLHHAGLLPAGATLRLATDAGLRPATVVATDIDGDPAGIVAEVDMGIAAVDPAAVEIDLEIDGQAVRATRVWVGNPHAVVFAAVPDSVRAQIVAALEARREAFPHGVNVEFVDSCTRPTQVRVHERGVGWTQACGTGACAVAAAAVANGELGARAGTALTLALAGGELTVTIAHDAAPGALRARMRGAARRVFAGVLDTPMRA